MNTFNLSYILASQSPRRRELFSLIANDFKVISPSCDEVIPKNLNIQNIAEHFAVQKAKSVAEGHSSELVVGCDTLVIHNNKILGKPKNYDEAYEMLSSLSGKTHTVATGVCLCCNSLSTSFSEYSEVTFYQLTDEEIKEYIESGDPFDKAGGYGIQTNGLFLIKGISGDYNSIVGLPVARLKRELKRFLGFINRVG